uniref:Uncharacterized protein n=1 Tax=Geospiza parvula TaxID=87175 RepID=A0A8U8C316_GEOPR
MPLLRRPPQDGVGGDPFAADPEGRRRRRATLGGLVGLGGLGGLGGHLGGHLGGPFGLRRLRDPAGPRGRRRSEDSGVARRAPEEAAGAKRGSLLRLALGTWGQRGTEKAAPGEGQVPPPVPPPCPHAVPAVLEILELIQRRHLVAADAQIIALEAECSLAPSPRDVALLYRALLAQLWAVVAESVTAPPAALAPLRAVVAVLEQEEAADARCPPGTRPGRPRGLRRRWHEAVAKAAGERLAQVAPAGGLGARLAALAARVVGDLGVVRSRVAPEYPPEWGALRVYARGYHRALGQQVRALAQRPLDVGEMYLLLDWHSNAYPREVLGHPDVGALLRAQELGPLLPPDTQRDLERSCIAAVKVGHLGTPRGHLGDTWGHPGDTPGDMWTLGCDTGQDMGTPWGHGDTGTRQVTQKPHPPVPRIGCPPGQRRHPLVTPLSPASFQRKVERFLDSPGELPPPDAAPGRAIALANCCPPFRALAERLAQCGRAESEEPRRQAHAALDRVTRACGHLLTRRLLEELKPHFGKLMKRKWLTSSDAFDAIVLVSELHRSVLIEYVRPLLQGRLVCAAKARARVAARLGDEARQLRELFTRLDSASPWLDSVVPRLRELLVLEDTAALQMEVGALARDFPDVRRRHVAALLDARGLRAQGPRREILGVLQDLGGSEPEPGPPRSRTFFAELAAPRPVRCLPFQLRLPRLPRRSPGTPGRVPPPSPGQE